MLTVKKLSALRDTDKRHNPMKKNRQIRMDNWNEEIRETQSEAMKTIGSEKRR